MTVVVGWGLALSLVLLVLVAVLASTWGRLGLGRAQAVAALRAIVQLAAVSLIITAAVQHIAGAIAFALVMFAVALWTTTGRTGTRRAWPWVALAMLAGVLPVLVLVFVPGAAPFNGITIVALGGIVTGNMMTAHTLAGRRSFAHLREHQGEYEAALALGMTRRKSIELLLEPVTKEALIPNLDTTRTVGLVTLPGAFIGVLLGGASPVEAGAAQILVLVAIMAGQALTVTVATRLMIASKDLPDDLRVALHA